MLTSCISSNLTKAKIIKHFFGEFKRFRLNLWIFFSSFQNKKINLRLKLNINISGAIPPPLKKRDSPEHIYMPSTILYLKLSNLKHQKNLRWRKWKWGSCSFYMDQFFLIMHGPKLKPRYRVYIWFGIYLFVC